MEVVRFELKRRVLALFLKIRMILQVHYSRSSFLPWPPAATLRSPPANSLSRRVPPNWSAPFWKPPFRFWRPKARRVSPPHVSPSAPAPVSARSTSIFRTRQPSSSDSRATSGSGQPKCCAAFWRTPSVCRRSGCTSSCTPSFGQSVRKQRYAWRSATPRHSIVMPPRRGRHAPRGNARCGHLCGKLYPTSRKRRASWPAT